MITPSLKLKSLFAVFILLANIHAFAADRYWIGNNTNKNWNATANWSTTSGGSGGASVPGTADNVYFNGGGTGQCSLNINISVKQISIDSSYTDTLKQNGYGISIGTGGYLQNGGTFSGSTTANVYTVIQGPFTLNKGRFISTRTRLTVQSAFTVNSPGIFSHNDGEVMFNGVYTIKSSITLYNCLFYPLSGVGGTYTLDPTTSLTITHLLTFTGVNINGTGAIHAQGDIMENGATVVSGGTATISIDGSTDQTFTGGLGTTPKFTGGASCSIYINKPSGTLFLSGYIVVGGNWTNNNNTTIDKGTSTVIFYGPKTITETKDFNNVSLFTPGFSATTTIASGKPLKVYGLLSIGGSNQNIDGANIEAKGDIAAIDYSSGLGFNSGTSSILINGDNNQKLTGYPGNTIGIEGFHNITVAKTGGVLTLEGIITVNGNWTCNAGSTIEMNDDPASANLVFSYPTTISGANHELKNVTFYAQSGAVIIHNINSSTVLTVTKNLTLQSFGSGRLNLNGGTVEAKGNIKILTGNGTSSVTYGGTTLLKINGDNNQTITGTSAFQAQTLFPHVEINKTSGTLTLDGYIIAGGNWTCTSPGAGIVPGNSTLAFLAGYTITGSQTLNDLYFNPLVSGANNMNIASGTTLSVRDLLIAGVGGTVINTGTINVERDVTITSTSNLGGGSGLINVNGSINQIITGTTALSSGYLCRLKIDKTNGVLTVKNKVHVTGDFTYAQGNSDLTTYQSTFVFTGTGTITTNGKHLNNVSFYSSTSTVPASDPLNVDGDLRFEDANGIIINTGTVYARGNIAVPNLVSVAGGGTGTVNICGTGNQTLSGNATATLRGSLCNLTIDKPSGTLTLANIITLAATSTWRYIQGTVDPGTSLVVVISGATINCGTASSSMEFYDFRVQGGSTTTNLSGVLNVRRHLTVDAARSLTTNSYNITVGGNFYSVGIFYAGASTVTLNGSGRQVVTVGAYFANLKIDKPSGKVYLSEYPLSIGNNLNLIKGVIVSGGAAQVKVFDNATVTGGSNQSYVAGPFWKIGDDAFTFPLGDTTLPDTSAYHPFAMTAPSGTTSSFTAQYFPKNQLMDHPTFTSYASTLKPISTCEYWSFTRNVGTSTITPTVSWNTNTCNINALADARVASWNGSQWADLGQNSTTGNQSAGTVKANTAGPNQTNQYYVLAERMPTPIPNQRYWIGNGSNTSWNNSANWSSVSGGPGGSPVPSSIDTVIFDGGGKGESNVDVNVSLMKLIVKPAYNANAIKQNSYTFTVGTGGMSLSGGTFTGDSGDITNNGSFTLSGTNFTSTSGTFTIYGNYTKSSGSFTHNNGKIVFNTSNTISGSTNFYNLEFAPAGDLTHTLNASDVYNVAGELKLSGTSRLTINAGTIHLNGNLTITNTNTNDPGSYTLSLEGNANQIVNGPAAKLQGALNQLIINKTGGSVTLNNFLSIAGNWTNTSNTTVTGSNTSTVVFTGGSKTISGNNHDFYNLNLYSNGPADGVYTISNAITANGELKLDGNYPAYVNGQINAKGNITAFNGSGSKVDGGTGTITINGTGNQLFSGYDAPMGSRLCNIVVDKASGTLTLANYLTPGHDWKHIKGTVAPGSSVTYITNTGSRKISGHNEFNDVVIYGELYNYDTSHTDVEDTLFVNGQLKYSMRSMTINGGYLAAKGNITIENDGDVVAGTHTLLITGGNNQLFKGLANKQQRGVLNHVTIDKPAGTLTLQDKLTVVGDWIWRNGNMDVDSYDNTLILRGGTRTFGGTHVLKNVTLDGYDTNDPSINNIPSGNVITIKGEFKIDGGHIARVNTGTIKALGNITSNNYAVTEDGGSGTIDIAGEGDQTISGQYAGGGLFCSIKVNKPNGTLNMSGAITLGGSNWTYIQGAVNPGTSKLIYWGNGDVNLVNGSTSMELNSFDLRKGTVNLLSPITARKDFWVSSANSTLNTNSHNINVGGYFLNGGTFNQGTTVITFNGTGRQDAYNANATTYYKIVINKPAGNVYVDGTFTINTNLSLIKGAMVPRNSSTSHYVKILDNATITGGSNKSFVMCGLMKVGDDAFTFPMGDTSLTDSSRYHPFIMPAPAGSVTYTVRYYSKNPLIDFPTYTAIQSPLQSISKCEYWYVEGGPAITPTLGWNENNCNVSSLSDIHVANWDGTQWKDLGNAATTGNTLKGSIQAASASTSAYDKYFVVGNINNVNLDPIASFQNTAGTCIGKTIKFQNTSKHASSYQWKVNNANVSTDVNLSYTFNSIGTYTITLVASNGTTTDTKDGNFVAGTGIAVDAGTDKTIPSGKNITLGGNPTAASGTAPFIYSWTSPSFLSSTIVSNPVAAPLVTTMYHVTVTDAQGCSGGDSILITVFPGFTALIDSTSDLDSGYVKIRLENGTPPYKFYWNGEESSTKEIIQAALDTLPIFDSLGINPSIFANQLSGSEKSYLAPGYYLVMVTDSLNDTAYAEVVISAARRWIVTPSANFDIQEKRITKTGGSGWANSELVSLQMLPNNRETYGGISFIAKTPASTQAVGFRTEPATGATGYDKLKYGFVVDNNALKIIDNGTQVSIGPYDANAVLRLERKDTLIVYSSDDSLLRIVSVPTLENNYISVNISSASTQIEIKSVSGISMEPRLSWTVTNALISPKESGSVKMNVNAPEVVNSFAYEWKNSDNTIIATTKDLTNALPGIYVFKLTYQTPFGSKDISKTIRVGGASKWDLTNVTLSDNPSFFQKPGGDGWNASITSFETLNPAEDAWFEFSVKNNSLSTDILYSFSASNGTSLSTVDYGIGAIKTSIGGNSNVIYYVVDHGVIKSSHAANKDDVFKVKYNAGSHLVDYLQNDKLIYTSPVVVTDPLYVRGNPIKGGGGVIEGPSKVLPEIEFKPSFAILKDKLDGSFYLAENGMLNLKYEEEYTGNTNKLIYRIYNSNGEVINSVSEAVQNVIFKNNYYSFYLDGFSKKIPKNNFYILEITTKKSEKKYLRFKY